MAPPRVGKTILLQNLAKGIHANHPEVELVLLLVDERPEEVTDMRRNVPGTVYASSNDNTIEKHIDLAQLVIERCKRQVEMGKGRGRAHGQLDPRRPGVQTSAVPAAAGP